MSRPIFAVVAIVIGAVLTWWGGSTLFADAVTADLEGTRGGLSPLPTAASVVGICASVWGLCVLAWCLAKALHSKPHTERRMQ